MCARLHGQLLICFLADVGFTVGKLFPTSYLCRSLDCAKITHNCVMTLAGFLFAAFECWGLKQMAEDLHEKRSERSESQSTLSTGMVKLVELVLCLAYIIYDVATTEPWSRYNSARCLCVPGRGPAALFGGLHSLQV